MRKFSAIAVLAAVLVAPSVAQADDMTWNVPSQVRAGETLTGSLTNTTTAAVVDFVLVPARGVAAAETSVKTQVTYQPATGDFRWTVPAGTTTGTYRLRAVQNLAKAMFKDVTVSVLSASIPTSGLPTQPTVPTAPTPSEPEQPAPATSTPSVDGGAPQSNGNVTASACVADRIVVNWKIGRYEGRALSGRKNVVYAPKGARAVFKVTVVGRNCGRTPVDTVGGFAGDLLTDSKGRVTSASYIGEKSRTLRISAGGKTVTIKRVNKR